VNLYRVFSLLAVAVDKTAGHVTPPVLQNVLVLYHTTCTLSYARYIAAELDGFCPSSLRENQINSPVIYYGKQIMVGRDVRF
jgi:hypothetical protein